MVDRPTRPKIAGSTGHAGSRASSSSESIVELVQALDDDLGLAQDRHEVGVSVPARDDVPVEMSGQSGPGRLPLVQPDVVTLRPEHPIEDHGHPAHRLDRLEQVRPLELRQRPPMHARGDQEMSIVVGISIEDDDRIRSRDNDEVLAILVAGQAAAEEAPRSRLGRGGGLVDVLRTPGSPDPIQQRCLTPAETSRPKPDRLAIAAECESPQDRVASLGIGRLGNRISAASPLSRKHACFRNGMSGIRPDRELDDARHRGRRHRRVDVGRRDRDREPVTGSRIAGRARATDARLRAADDPRRDNNWAQARADDLILGDQDERADRGGGELVFLGLDRTWSAGTLKSAGLGPGRDPEWRLVSG